MMYTCSEEECTCETNCGENMTLLVQNSTNSSVQPLDLPSIVDCKVGDTVKLVDVRGWAFKVYEVNATAQLGKMTNWSWKIIDFN